VDNPRSERPAKSRRPARRSMANLLAVLQSDGGAQLPLTLSVATAADVPAAPPDAPADTPAKPLRMHAHATDANADAKTSEKASQAPAAALGSASSVNGDGSRPGGNGHAPAPALPLPVPGPAADELRAKALEIVNANVNATLDYARELAQVRSATEFITLSTSHARRRLELMMTHAATLAALSQVSPRR
jgi:hypothetical protein